MCLVILEHQTRSRRWCRAGAPGPRQRPCRSASSSSRTAAAVTGVRSRGSPASPSLGEAGAGDRLDTDSGSIELEVDLAAARQPDAVAERSRDDQTACLVDGRSHGMNATIEHRYGPRRSSLPVGPYHTRRHDQPPDVVRHALSHPHRGRAPRRSTPASARRSRAGSIAAATTASSRSSTCATATGSPRSWSTPPTRPRRTRSPTGCASSS